MIGTRSIATNMERSDKLHGKTGRMLPPIRGQTLVVGGEMV